MGKSESETPIAAFSLGGAEADSGANAVIEELKETSEACVGFVGCALADSSEFDTLSQQLELPSIETCEIVPALKKSESESPIGAFSLGGAEADRGADADIEELKETSETCVGFLGCARADSLEFDTLPQRLELPSAETCERALALEKSESETPIAAFSLG